MKLSVAHAVHRRLGAPVVTAALLGLIPFPGAGAGASADDLVWSGAIDNNWDTTTANWTGDDATFTDGDAVVFGATGAGAISITPGGVAPSTVTIDTTGYSFTGGPITGAANILLHSGTSTAFHSANDFTGNLTLSYDGGSSSNVTSTASGALGHGTVFTTAGTTNNVILSTNVQTQSANFDYTAARLIFAGNAPIATLTGTLTGGSTLLQVQGSGILEIRGAFVGTTGDLMLNSTNPTVSISDDATQLPDGNLNITSGSVVLDGIGWSGFTRAASQGSGAGQWRVSNTGGFAARGVDVVIDTGNWDNTNFGIGNSNVIYANASVEIAQAINLGTDVTRTITVRGANSAVRTVDPGLTWNIVGPVHELSGKLSGTNVALSTQGLQGAGTLRLSNDANDFTGSVNVLPTSNGNVLIATSDGVFGDAANSVSVGAAGTGGNIALLLLEDQTGAGTTFNRDITVHGSTSVNNRAGVGSYAGQVTYTGTLTLTQPDSGSSNDLGHVAFYTHAGSTMTLGTDANQATITNNRTSATGGGHFDKIGDGELILDNVAYNGPASTFHWRIYGGKLTTTSAANLLSSGDLNLQTLLLAPTSPGSEVRTWRVAEVDQTFDNVTGGPWNGSPVVEVDAGITLTTNVVSGALTGPGGAGTTLRKTGAGTWVYNSAVAQTGGGGVSSVISVDEGTLDLHGNTGHTIMAVNGGALLFSHDSAFTDNRPLHITAAGGKVGVSINATGDVTRTATPINAWTQGGDVTFAARDDFDLVFANASFPDITAGTVRFERDGSGGGVVQINDTAVNVTHATIGGSGALRLSPSGTGTLILGAGAVLAPGSSPGILTLEANVVFTADASFAVEIVGSAAGVGYDQLNVIGAVDLGGASLTLVGVPRGVQRGQLLTLINNDGSDPITGTFANLGEGDKVYFAGRHFAFISYVGGTGNDVVLTIIPEPASAVALLIGTALTRRRHRPGGRTRIVQHVA